MEEEAFVEEKSDGLGPFMIMNYEQKTDYEPINFSVTRNHNSQDNFDDFVEASDRFSLGTPKAISSSSSSSLAASKVAATPASVFSSPHLSSSNKNGITSEEDDKITNAMKSKFFFTSLWYVLKESGWTLAQGRGLIDARYIMPGTSKEEENVGYNVFESQHSLLDHLKKNNKDLLLAAAEKLEESSPKTTKQLSTKTPSTNKKKGKTPLTQPTLEEVLKKSTKSIKEEGWKQIPGDEVNPFFFIAPKVEIQNAVNGKTKFSNARDVIPQLLKSSRTKKIIKKVVESEFGVQFSDFLSFHNLTLLPSTSKSINSTGSSSSKSASAITSISSKSTLANLISSKTTTAASISSKNTAPLTSSSSKTPEKSSDKQSTKPSDNQSLKSAGKKTANASAKSSSKTNEKLSTTKKKEQQTQKQIKTPKTIEKPIKANTLKEPRTPPETEPSISSDDNSMHAAAMEAEEISPGNPKKRLGLEYSDGEGNIENIDSQETPGASYSAAPKKKRTQSPSIAMEADVSGIPSIVAQVEEERSQQSINESQNSTANETLNHSGHESMSQSFTESLGDLTHDVIPEQAHESENDHVHQSDAADFVVHHPDPSDEIQKINGPINHELDQVETQTINESSNHSSEQFQEASEASNDSTALTLFFSKSINDASNKSHQNNIPDGHRLFANMRFEIIGSIENDNEGNRFNMNSVLESQIEHFGGKIVKDFSDDAHGQHYRISSPQSYLEYRYLASISCKIPVLHYLWIIDSMNQKILLPWEQYILPAGLEPIQSRFVFLSSWDDYLDESNQSGSSIYPAPIARDKRVLYNMNFAINLPSNSNSEEIEKLIIIAGGNIVKDANGSTANLKIVYDLLSNPESSSNLLDKSIVNGSIMVSFEWVISCIILGIMPSHENKVFKDDLSTSFRSCKFKENSRICIGEVLCIKSKAYVNQKLLRSFINPTAPPSSQVFHHKAIESSSSTATGIGYSDIKHQLVECLRFLKVKKIVKVDNADFKIIGDELVPMDGLASNKFPCSKLILGDTSIECSLSLVQNKIVVIKPHEMRKLSYCSLIIPVSERVFLSQFKV